MPKYTSRAFTPPSITAHANREALGQSDAFLFFQEQLARVAPVDRPVLIIGERGTGKELAAGRLHFLSGRWQGPFVTLNCATLSASLIESELFGHEKGAFTGAELRRSGRFEMADGGTLFLDELGFIPKEVQAKILRVVEYGAFERVGGSQPVEVDVRIIGATNANLPAKAEQGEFLLDLLDRLSFEVLNLPPLRKRKEDIPLLARHFAARMAFELGRETSPDFSDASLTELETYSWPGNIRELKNVVERAVYKSDSTQIEHIVFNPFQAAEQKITPGNRQHEAVQLLTHTAPEPPSTLKDSVHKLENEMLNSALIEAQFNQRKAAVILGLSYDQFRGLYRKHRSVAKPDRDKQTAQEKNSVLS